MRSFKFINVLSAKNVSGRLHLLRGENPKKKIGINLFPSPPSHPLRCLRKQTSKAIIFVHEVDVVAWFCMQPHDALCSRRIIMVHLMFTEILAF